MTALPTYVTRPLTVADYLALGETEARTELQEGNLVMSPSPSRWHSRVLAQLIVQLVPQLSADVLALPENDLDLELDSAAATVRRPDLYVVSRAEFESEAESALVRARGVVLVIEIVSPGSRRTDRIVKAAEYADAGIGSYWIIEPGQAGPKLTELRRGPSGYEAADEATGSFATDSPFPVRLNLDALT